MDARASSRFVISTDPHPDKLDRGRNFANAVMAAGHLLTDGLVPLELPVRVIVKDRLSGATVVEYKWGSTEGAVRHIEHLRRRLDELTVDQFLAEYATDATTAP